MTKEATGADFKSATELETKKLVYRNLRLSDECCG